MNTVCKYASMQVCKYACMHVCTYASMQVCKYASMLVCKYARMHVCMYASMQVCKYASMQVCKYARIQYTADIGRPTARSLATDLCGVDTSYFNEGHCSTDKHISLLIIMYTNGYNSIPVMAGLKKRRKKIKELDSFDYLVVFALSHTLWHFHKTGNGIIAM